MTPKQTIRAMNAVNGETIAPNWLIGDAHELEARGLMVFRNGVWKTTAEGRAFIREYEAQRNG